MASVPTVVGRASHWSPLRTSVPFVIVAVTLPLGTPGTAIRIGLAIPAYNTFISIGATVILPGEAKEVTGYDDNEIVKFFIGQGNLSEVKSRTAAKEK